MNTPSTTAKMQTVSSATFGPKNHPVTYRAVDLSPSNSPQTCFPVEFAPYTRSHTESRQRWQVLATIRENWDPNALEPMPVSGISPLLEFTERRDGSFYCMVPAGTGICNHRNAKKSRMLSHIRKDHLNFRPFPCGGQCGTQGW